MRVAYVEMIGGASGNMLLGALIDAGADPAAIERALRTIPVTGWKLEQTRRNKLGIDAAYVDFALPGEDCAPGEMAVHGHHLSDILDLIERSQLSGRVRERASAIYRRLAEAEARVHGTTVDAIHFHEVGQIDAVLDVAGVCVALDLLGVERVMCSPFPLGRGSLSMHHGSHYPNPPPATAELLRGAPTQPTDVAGELVTTTAAAILTTLVADPGVRPAMRFERIGYGAGRSDFTIPNVTRIIIGELVSVTLAGAGDAAGSFDPPGTADGADSFAPASAGDIAGSFAPAGAGELMTDEVVVLETNIDDLTPQAYELAVERLFAAGALDVWTAPIAMKKQRPGVLFSAIATREGAAACVRAMLRETSSIGVRTRRETRFMLAREIVRRLTPYGEVRCKRVRAGGVARVTLEYDDVARIARERGLPFAAVAAELTRAMESAEEHERNLV